MAWMYKFGIHQKIMVIEAMNIDDVTWGREHRVKKEEDLGRTPSFNGQVEKDKLATNTKKKLLWR